MRKGSKGQNCPFHLYEGAVASMEVVQEEIAFSS